MGKVNITNSLLSGPVTTICDNLLAFPTNIPGMFVIESSSHVKYPKMRQLEAGDIHLTAEGVLRDTYLAFSLTNKFRYSLKNMSKKICTAQTKSLGSDELIHVTGMRHALILGDCINFLTCKEDLYDIETSPTHCYDNAVEIKGPGIKFVKVNTRTLTNVASIVKCNRNFPLVVKVEEGFLEFSPEPRVIPALPPVPENIADSKTPLLFGLDSLYTKQQLQDFEDRVEFVQRRTGTLHQLSMASCPDNKCFISTHDNYRTTGWLGPVSDSVKGLAKPLTSGLFAELKSVLEEYSSILSIIAIMLITLKFLVHVLITVTFLIRTPVHQWCRFLFHVLKEVYTPYIRAAGYSQVNQMSNNVELHDLKPLPPAPPRSTSLNINTVDKF